MDKKILGIYYKRLPNREGYLYTPESTPENCWWYVDAMRYIVEFFSKGGVDVVYLLGEDCYLGQGAFRNYWEMDFETGQLEKINKIIKPDIVYDKGHMEFYDGCFKIFNSPALAQLGRNKWSQYALFKQYQPKTVVVNSASELAKKTAEIPGETIVSKPLGKNGGRDIFIGKKEDLRVLDYPVLLQEYHETSSGVSGIAERRHDIRLIMLDNEIVVAAVRQPAGDKLLANAHQGGTIKFFDPSKLPKTVTNMAKAVDDKLTGYGNRLYSSDFLFDGNGWYLIEINDRPGLPAIWQNDDGAVEGFYQKFYERVLKWSEQ
jgi:hypothetical protein